MSLRGSKSSRMNGNKARFRPAFAGIAVAAVVAVFLFKDALVISAGIRTYRLIRILICAAVGVYAGRSLYLMKKSADDEKLLTEARNEYAERKRLEKISSARLSMKGRLRNHELRNLLSQQTEETWRAVSETASKCVMQMKQMDNYQEKLHSLLEDNGADSFSDAEEVLDGAEQYMCRNVRKVLNYMSVADPKTDAGMIEDKLKECVEKNGEQITQTQEFVYAMTEYLNHQGEDGADAGMLEIYKAAILKSIGEEIK